jgi:hypothetical protein
MSMQIADRLANIGSRKIMEEVPISEYPNSTASSSPKIHPHLTA